MNLLSPLPRALFQRGCKGTPYFLISKSFCKNFSIFFVGVSLSKELMAFTATRFSKGVQRYDFFPNLQIFLQQFLTFFDNFFNQYGIQY